MNISKFFASLKSSQSSAKPLGITSICTANPLVIEACFAEAKANDERTRKANPILIEATCNQVNQDGGYTGMNPAGFISFVHTIADRANFPHDQIIFGGDHLGPNPWRHLPHEQAMKKAMQMMADYAQAGFSKIHLDASMSCADDPAVLPPRIIAERAARLAQIAETAAGNANHQSPIYIIGTEVPVPGGANEIVADLAITSISSVKECLEAHEVAFASLGLAEAYQRIVGLVVQPGVEFGHQNVVAYISDKARALCDWRAHENGPMFEAHSTDYQTASALRELVVDGFGILKVGPGLTFALREALYGLDQIAGQMTSSYNAGQLSAAMEDVMLDAPANWEAYYDGGPREQKILRHFSYSDRIRYYWPDPTAQSALEKLFAALEGQSIPETLVSQYMPALYRSVMEGIIGSTAHDLMFAATRLALAPYSHATLPE